jgi:hypothetical protein
MADKPKPQGDDMTTETFNTIDIQVMKSELTELRNDVHQIGAKMDVILQMQVAISQLQERHETQKGALDRAFSAIKENKHRSDSTNSELSRWVSFIKGGAAVAALLYGFTQWYMLQQIDKLEKTSGAYFSLDRRITFVETKIWPDLRPGEKANGK